MARQCSRGLINRAVFLRFKIKQTMFRARRQTAARPWDDRAIKEVHKARRSLHKARKLLRVGDCDAARRALHEAERRGKRAWRLT